MPVSDEKEGGKDAEDADEIDAVDTYEAFADNAAPDDDNCATMPPKLKAPPRKPGAKKISSLTAKSCYGGEKKIGFVS